MNTPKDPEEIRAAWIAKLEQERFDMSYKEHTPEARRKARIEAAREADELLLVELRAKKRKIKADSSELAKIYWNAGRYAAGHRDQDATAAIEKIKAAAAPVRAAK